MGSTERFRMAAGVCIVALVSALAYLVYANISLNHKLDSVLNQASAAPIASVNTSVPAASGTAPFIDPKAGDPMSGSMFSDTWDPFQDMQAMQQRIDQMFGNALGHMNQSGAFPGGLDQSLIMPRMDLTDEGDHFVAKVNIPGSDNADINVTMEDNVLHVSATSKEESSNSGKGTALRQERRIGRFERDMTLPKPVDAKSLQTSYEDGVLTITIKKSNN